MKSKFDFYEIVKINTTDPKKTKFKDQLGYIRGKAEPEVPSTKTWGYAVLLFGNDFLTSFEENELESTGEFFDKTKIPNFGSIRVTVDEHGAGCVKASYKSYADIENAIKNSQASKASGFMIEAGMVSADLEPMYQLIDLCIQNNDQTIRSAGYSALWHLLLRFKRQISMQFLMKNIRIGLADQNEHVLETIDCILEDLQNIAPDVWEQIEKYK